MLGGDAAQRTQPCRAPGDVTADSVSVQPRTRGAARACAVCIRGSRPVIQFTSQPWGLARHMQRSPYGSHRRATEVHPFLRAPLVEPVTKHLLQV